MYPARLFSQLLSLPAWPRGWSLVTPLLEAAFAAQVRLYRRTQALQLVTAAFRNGALVGAAPSAELETAAAQLEAGVQQVRRGGGMGGGGAVLATDRERPAGEDGRCVRCRCTMVLFDPSCHPQRAGVPALL